MKYFIVTIAIFILTGCGTSYQTSTRIEKKDRPVPLVKDTIALQVPGAPTNPLTISDSTKPETVLIGQTNISNVEVKAKGKPEDVQGFKEAAKKVELTAETKTQPPPLHTSDTVRIFNGHTDDEVVAAEAKGFKWGSGMTTAIFLSLLIAFLALRSKLKALLPFLLI